MIIDKDGKDISSGMNIEHSLLSVIAPLLEKNFSSRRIMLIHNCEITEDLNEAVSKFSAEAVVVDTTSHACIPDNYKKSLSVPMIFLSSNMEYFYNSSEDIKFFPFWLIATRFFSPNKIIIGSDNKVRLGIIEWSVLEELIDFWEEKHV